MYIVILGQVNGTAAYFGPFTDHMKARTFMYSELSPKASEGARMHVVGLHPENYVVERKTVKFI